MSTMTIRKLDDSVKVRLRMRAAQHGRSMEEEAREILRGALENNEAKRENLVLAIRRRFEPLGGVELPDMQREPIRQAPAFD